MAILVKFSSGEKMQNDNLPYVQLVSKLTEQEVLLVNKLYAIANADGIANL